MGTIITNTFEGGTDGGIITIANSGGASGSAFGALVYNNVSVGGSGNANLAYSSALRARGNMAARITLAGSVSYLRLDLVDTGTRYVARRYFYYEAMPTGNYTLLAMYAGATLAGSIVVTSDGKITPYRGSTALTTLKSTAALTTGAWYAIEYAITPETGGGGNGIIEWRLMTAAETQIETKNVTAQATGTGAITYIRYASSSSTTSGLTYDYLDELRGGPLDSGWIGPVTGGAPTVNTSEATSYAVDARSSTGDATLTYSIAWSSGPNNLSSVVEPVDGVFLIPLATTAAVYVITASDGTLTTNHNVSVPASVAALPDTTRRRTWSGSSWV
ncbi:MAG: hypothetical protein ACOH18_00555 [Candidatus Saccharimonadaceae bacterium]